MAANRISRHLNRERAAPKPPSSAPNSSVPSIPTGFALCPPQLAGGSAWQQEIYRLAYERAKAALQVPRHHRRLFCVWN